MEKYRGKKVVVVGLGKTGFALINLFNSFGAELKVTDIKPIFDLSKPVKRLKKMNPTPQMTLGEHRDEDFLGSDLIVYSSSVDPNLPQLQRAREHGKEVHSEFSFAYVNCGKPVIAVCGSKGRTTIAHMIGYTLKLDKKKIFVGTMRQVDKFVQKYFPNDLAAYLRIDNLRKHDEHILQNSNY